MPYEWPRMWIERERRVSIAFDSPCSHLARPTLIRYARVDNIPLGNASTSAEQSVLQRVQLVPPTVSFCPTPSLPSDSPSHHARLPFKTPFTRCFHHKTVTSATPETSDGQKEGERRVRPLAVRPHEHVTRKAVDVKTNGIW